VAVLATDVPTTVLIVGVLILGATTAISALALPPITLSLRRRRSRPTRPLPVTAPDRYVPATYRRVITGQPASLPPVDLPADSRQTAGSTDDHPTSDEVAAAQALIEQLIEEEPQRLADLMNSLIRADDQQFRPGAH